MCGSEDNVHIKNDKVISYLMLNDQSTGDWIWLNDTEKRRKEYKLCIVHAEKGNLYTHMCTYITIDHMVRLIVNKRVA